MHCLKLPQVADMISCAQLKKIKTMKKSIMILMMVATGFFCSRQSSTDSVYTGTVDSVKAIDVVPREPNGPTKAGLAKALLRSPHNSNILKP
jgi:hypothetical protein